MDKKRQLISEIHRPARINFKRRSYVIKHIDDLFEADLLDLSNHAKENGRHTFILTVIDAFSKYAWAVGLRSKSAVDVTEGMRKIFLMDKRIPLNLHTDNGREFYNSHFKKLMKEYKINHYSNFSTKKAAIVERFNRTLKEKLYREFSYHGNYKWRAILPQLMSDYNHTFHRTIKCAPIDVDNLKQKQLIANKTFTINDSPSHSRPKFRIGDKVRISKYKGIFEKKYTPNWSAEIFTIYRVNGTNPVTYLLEDYNGDVIKGAFYQLELTPAKYDDVFLVEKILKTRKNGDRLVKWFGYPEKSWVKPQDIY